MNEKTEKAVTGQLKKKIHNIKKVVKLAGEASSREYYRIVTGSGTLVAMVYPENNPGEIEKVRTFTDVYRNNGLNVPGIVDQIDEKILIQEDVGDISLQKYLSDVSEKELLEVKNKIRSILEKLKSIPSGLTGYMMDKKKIEFEINFFIDNFVKRLVPHWKEHDELFEEIIDNLRELNNARVFAHRDFHSRNIFFKDGDLFLIDFQDSLRAPEFYDAVSFVFDSYLKAEHSAFFFSLFENRDENEIEQVYLTGYQRNIKALGTFGYQNYSGNKKFFKYIIPAINNLKKNIYYSEKSLLGRLFSQFEGTIQV
ncbi:MAG: phosphotransferase [Acidobacteriota bacterium]